MMVCAKSFLTAAARTRRKTEATQDTVFLAEQAIAVLIGLSLACAANADGVVRASTVATAWGKGGRPFAADWTPRGEGPRFAGYHDPSVVDIGAEAITISPYFDGKDVHTGAASTYGRFRMGAGSVEATLRVCLQAPLRTAIWLQSSSNTATNGRVGPGREIDVVEIYNSKGLDEDARATHTVHMGGYGDSHESFGMKGWVSKPCETHTYQVSIDSTGYVFRLDGKVVGRLADRFQGEDEYLIFSVEAPGNFGSFSWKQPERLGFATLTTVKVVAASNVYGLKAKDE